MNKKAKNQPEPAQVEIVAIEPLQIEPLDEPPLDGDGRVRGTVAMSRALVNAQQGLTLNEKRVMMAALRCIDSKKSPYLHGKGNGYVSVRVRADEFAALAALAPRSGEKQATAAYEGLKEGCASLQKRQLTYMDGPRKVVLNWVWKAVYHEREGWAEVSFSPDLTPHIFMLQRRFVSYQLEFARGLQSLYSWRLLELLMRERDRGRLLITLDDFRHVLEIPTTYRFADIKRRVIETAVNELNAKADLVISWTPVKLGRAVNSLDFKFVQNPQSRLALDGEPPFEESGAAATAES
ncbi:replication initiation protein [Burkholderia vietnamiensis]|uniref:replication initiation protein n=1 Tax=Burkholderia vietnamiensis TaxID=60552 RepID=UPI00075E3B5A|nr:replication initiation protein [Burkholderia vietnamiensis]AOK42587.1 replication protein RepB [Burkholderia vietnamiensis]KVR82582.1 replication protein RepB [Burkholderia vietnamiensis]KVR89949.1 replication protein RepB [Burkholderia vietnamiensis]KVR93225.1 replication protein RepB [Burkholderia vietnamiensis]MBR7917129.1 replication initiation protein [Burkholderia vietnamiensis]